MKSHILLLCVTCFLLYPVRKCASQEEDMSEDQLRDIERDLAKLFKIKKYSLMETEHLKNIFVDLQILKPQDTRNVLIDKTLCGACQLLIKKIERKSITTKVLADALCKIYITISTWTITDFCADILKINLPILEYIVENSQILDSELACSILLQNSQCYYDKPALKWRIDAPSASQRNIPSKERQVTYGSNAKPIKILHLSDFHISPDYEIGGVEKCGYPVCCKKGLGNPIFGSSAGTWGDYNCDIPVWLFGNAMMHINKTHKDIDMVYFTGDIIDHTVWKASVEENSRLIYFTYKTLYETFPNKTILPVIGNHESAPLNIFAPTQESIENENLSTQWLYTLSSKLWRPWLPIESLRTVEKQGYYSFSVNKKFKVISLNNNVCYIYNWWVLYNTTFLSEQLTFLSDELEKAEQNGEYVHIITHIPVGNKECIEPWEASYQSLIRRFSHIIKGQFYGHTHTDELKLFYDENGEPINVGYNGASLTPYQKYNPNYKVITVDSNTYDILDIDTYTYNLTDANLNPAEGPQWIKLYSMKEAYGLDNLSSESMHSLAKNIYTNSTFLERYWRFYVRNGDASLSDGCDVSCQKDIVCKIFTTESCFSENCIYP